MRYSELNESMSFSAGAKGKDGYWRSSVESGDPYTDEFYKNTDKYMYGDEEAPANPDYKPDLDLTLSNSNMREVMAKLGYPTDLEERGPFPIDEFIAKTTQWLQKAIGKPSPGQEPQVQKTQHGATMISGGKPQGYFNRAIKQMNYIAREGKREGATHVWAS